MEASKANSGPSKRIQSVESLRGLAALAVTWFHLTNGHSSWIKETGSLGWLGVEVFFVISGFVIPMSVGRGFKQYRVSQFPRFLARRLVRLEPPYLLSIFLVLALWELSARAPGFAGGAPTWTIDQVMLHFLYLIPLTDEVWLQSVYWTLAYEFAFYIFVGLFFSVISSKMVVFVLLVSLIWGLAIGPLPVLFILFVIGMAVYRSYEHGDHFLITFGVIAASGILMWLQGSKLEAFTGVGTSLLILATTNLRWDSKLGTSFLWLGTVSYSLYLLHMPIGGRVVNLGRRFFPNDATGELAISLVALGISLIAAWIFYRFVEVPAIKASRKILAERPHKTD